MVRSVSFYNQLGIMNLTKKNRGRDKCFFKIIEYFTVRKVKVSENILLNETDY